MLPAHRTGSLSYTNLCIWIEESGGVLGPLGGPWSVQSEAQPPGRVQFPAAAARGRRAPRRKRGGESGAWPGNSPSASHSSYADRHTTWRTRIVGRRARIQRRTRRNPTSTTPPAIILPDPPGLGRRDALLDAAAGIGEIKRAPSAVSVLDRVPPPPPLLSPRSPHTHLSHSRLQGCGDRGPGLETTWTWGGRG